MRGAALVKKEPSDCGGAPAPGLVFGAALPRKSSSKTASVLRPEGVSGIVSLKPRRLLRTLIIVRRVCPAKLSAPVEVTRFWTRPDAGISVKLPVVSVMTSVVNWPEIWSLRSLIFLTETLTGSSADAAAARARTSVRPAAQGERRRAEAETS